MKIGIVSDIHEDFESLKRAADYLSSRNPDLIIVPGDFVLKPYSVDDFAEFIKSKDERKFLNKIFSNMNLTFLEAKKILDSSGVPYLIVPGNYDGINIDEVFGDKNLNRKSVNKSDLKLFGYGGSDSLAPHMAPLAQLVTTFDHQELYERLHLEKPNLVVLHNPPHELCDDLYNGQNVGTLAAKVYLIEKIQEEKDEEPKLIIAGHIHEAGPSGANPNGVKGTRKVKNTVVINPGNVGRFGLFKLGNLDPMIPMEKFEYGTFSEVEIDPQGQVKKVRHFSVKNPEKETNKIRTLEEIIF